jgi:hypothetical protein
MAQTSALYSYAKKSNIIIVELKKPDKLYFFNVDRFCNSFGFIDYNKETMELSLMDKDKNTLTLKPYRISELPIQNP